MSTIIKRKPFHKFYDIAKRLRDEFPADLPIKIRRKDLGTTHFGYASKTDKCYYIYIHSGLYQSLAIYILLHEMSHIQTWRAGGPDHGQEWGKAYSRVYKWYEKNCLK